MTKKNEETVSKERRGRKSTKSNKDLFVVKLNLKSVTKAPEVFKKTMKEQNIPEEVQEFIMKKCIPDLMHNLDTIAATKTQANCGKKINKFARFNELGGIIEPITACVARNDAESVVSAAFGSCKSTWRHVGYLAAVKDPKHNRIFVGVSFCIPSDYSVFDTSRGRRQAASRAITAMMMHDVISFKHNTNEDLLHRVFTRYGHSLSVNTYGSRIYVFEHSLADQVARFAHRCMRYFYKTDEKHMMPSVQIFGQRRFVTDWDAYMRRNAE